MAHETQFKMTTLKKDKEEINPWKKIKTQSINVREQQINSILTHSGNRQQ